MAHHHHHHHHHNHGDVVAEGPLDAANQSLADALRTSFSILKLVMIVLVIMYLFSGVQCIEEHEEGVVLRFGKLQPNPRPPGPSFAFPYPIDETLVFPTKLNSTFTSMEHWPNVPHGQANETLSAMTGGAGLKPGLDGALMTADRGLVHIQWAITFQVDDIYNYVLNVGDDDKFSGAHALITDLLQSVAAHVVSKYTAEDVTRGKSGTIANEVKTLVNDRLDALKTGVRLVALDVPRSSVPGQTVAAFTAVANAENEKQQTVNEAIQRSNDMLNRVAGAAHQELLDAINALETAEAAGDNDATGKAQAEIDDLLETRVAGLAGNRINQAKAFYTQTLQRVQGDLQQYNAALDEYLVSRELFVNRMWQRTRRKVLNYDELEKNLLPPGAMEIRIKVPPDPKAREIDERRQLEKEADHFKFRSQEHARIVQ